MSDAIRWLLEEGGPVIRYRTATELARGLRSPDREQLERELLASPLVRRWLACVTPETGFNEIHGSKPTAFETALGKLAQLGCRAGMPALDRCTAPVRRWLARPPERQEPDLTLIFARNVAAKSLYLAGYREPAVTRIVRARLERVARFCRRRDYDIYVDPSRYAGFPRMFAGRPLVDPALSPLGETPMPSIRDVHAFGAMRGRAGATTRQKIDAVARYFASPGYDALARGYGICQLAPRRFWAIGWDVRLPEQPSGLALQNLLLFARFPAARRVPRFRRWLERLESFRDGDGSYSLPRAMLPEKRVAYWVAGGHLGLEESRRSAKSLRLESTFYALELKSLLRS